MAADSWMLTGLIMAKLPQPGQVKTRLVSDGRFSDDQAAAIAAAMARCIVGRVAARGPVVVALAPDGCGKAMAECLGPDADGCRFIDQGPGDLGQRMARAWSAIASDNPVAFFGNDSPDIPGNLLDAIQQALATHDIALGPTDDGGIWTLAAGRRQTPLLDEIDWGTEHVYDQLRRRAQQFNATVAELPSWVDVDRPNDVDQLLVRLAALDQQSEQTPDAALARLARELAALGLTAPADDCIQ